MFVEQTDVFDFVMALKLTRLQKDSRNATFLPGDKVCWTGSTTHTKTSQFERVLSGEALDTQGMKTS